MIASARRLIFSLLLAFSAIFFVGVTNVHAQTQSSALGTDSNVPTNLHNVTQVVMLETMAGVLCQLTGVDYVHPDQKCLGVDSTTHKIGFTGNGGGMIGAMGTIIGATLSPPISSRQYFSYLKNNFGITKHVYAETAAKPCDQKQGVGFCGLWPIIDLWLAMRNIVYLLFILVFVVIGLGIMLRVHIDPQTVMTLQNQIPKIIIGIIGITFSFAIIGLLIDIMWVATYLFGSVLNSAAGGKADFISVISATNPFNAAAQVSTGVGGIAGIAGTTSDAFANVIKDIFTGPASNFSSGGPVMDVVGGIVFFFVNLLAWLIIAIGVVVALIRLWVILIVSYLNIIMDAVFAPFWILAGIVPGSPISLGSWIRDVIANLAVFPLTVSFFILAEIFMNAFGASRGRFIPPLIGGVDPTAISALIGLGFLFSMPNLLTATKAALKAPKIDLGPILGPVGAGARTVTGAIRGYGATQVASREYVAGEGGKFHKRGLTASFLSRTVGRG